VKGDTLLNKYISTRALASDERLRVSFSTKSVLSVSADYTHKFITSIQRQILVKKNVKQEIEVMIKENVYFVKHQQQTRTQSSTWCKTWLN
jgi:hypothetical protein